MQQQEIATKCSDAELSVLVRQAVATAKRYCSNRPYLDPDAVESEALEAAVEAKRRWEEERATLSDFAALVINSKLKRALARGQLYADADSRRLGAVPIDTLEGDADSEPHYLAAAADEFDAADFVARLPISESDRELLRERLGGDCRYTGRDDLSPPEVRSAIRRIRKAASISLNGGSPCSH